jgi:hypothetical protein
MGQWEGEVFSRQQYDYRLRFLVSLLALPGIGKLFLVKRKARMGRNPATGEAIEIPAKTVVKMRVAKAAIVPGRK